MEYTYKVVDGDNSFTYYNLESLLKTHSSYGYTEDSNVLRYELCGQPKLKNYYGPMYNGLSEEGNVIIMYENKVAYCNNSM